MRLPFPTPPTRGFGPRWLVLPGRPGFWNDHIGIDWSKAPGTPIIAAASGTVIGNLFTSLKGHQLVVRDDEGRIHRYHMLLEKSPKKVGERVLEGTQIGRAGSSGSASTGDHLHYELWINGRPIDPYLYVTTGKIAGIGDVIEIEEDMPLTDAEIAKIASAVWNTKINRTSGQTAALQELANLTGAVAAVPTKVWAEEVQRTGGPVNVKQELADAKTNTIKLLAQPATGGAEIDYDKLADAIVAKLPAQAAPLTQADVVEAIKSVTYKAL